ncbi:MAG: hypothetical protein GPJ51_04315 [Candidatus Heimdallarchaeota archaeon]|nr:hypothetical protein [Candidatus Heimdallarchaeota archaeon]
MTTLYDYIGEKDKKVEEERIKEEESRNEFLTKMEKQKRLSVNFTGFDGRLSDLVDGIRTIPNYNNLKGYVRENVLPDNPEISYEKLSFKTGIHEGVALVILYDLYNDKLEEELKDLDEEDVDRDFRYD